jgi:zona occludens toxin
LVNPGHSALLVEYWQFWATEGSLIVLDEVQRVWRPIGSKVPDEIAALETHRHKVLDFWLISQGPDLFHSNIRLLIGRHIHLVSAWRGRNEYEFPECRQNVTSRSDAVVRPYSLPKKIFKLYKSASLHTVSKHRKPLSFYFLIVVICIGSGLGLYAKTRFDKRFHPETAVTSTGEAGAPPVDGTLTTLTTEEKKSFPDFEPSVPGIPESAPAYSELLKVSSVPLLVGCIYSKAKDICTCYTAQATPYPTNKEYCLLQIENKRFNPYLEIKKFEGIFKTDKKDKKEQQAEGREVVDG